MCVCVLVSICGGTEGLLVLCLGYELNAALALVLRNLPSGRHSEEIKHERPEGCRVFGENIRHGQNIPHGSKGTGSTFFIKYE